MKNIQLFEGGERLYIFAFAYDCNGFSGVNKLTFIDTYGKAYENRLIVTTGPWENGCPGQIYLPRGYSKNLYFKKFLYILKRYYNLQRLKDYGVKHSLRYFSHYWEATTPVPAIEVYPDNYISTNGGQIYANYEGWEYLENPHFAPSQKWFEEHIASWLEGKFDMYEEPTKLLSDVPESLIDEEDGEEYQNPEYSEIESYYRQEEDKRNFATWKEKMEKQGLTIGYICSLDS